MKSLNFGDIVRHKPADNKKAVVISPVDDGGYFWLLYEEVMEDELAHIDDCEIVDNEFIRLCQIKISQISTFERVTYFGRSALTFLSDIGLQASEWDYIKNNIGIEWLEDELKADIEEYIEGKKK